MSHSCNYCSMQFIKSTCKKGNKIVEFRHSRELLLTGGVNVYEIPSRMSRRTIEKMSEEDRETYFRAWFMELTRSCACD